MKINKGKTVDGGLYLFPIIGIFFHSHSGTIHIWDWSDKYEYPTHFHLGITWLFWFIELQIGKDFIDGDLIN